MNILRKMDEIAFSDWPGSPVDLSGSNPWLPAYGYQPPSSLLDKEDFLGNPGQCNDSFDLIFTCFDSVSCNTSQQEFRFM